MSERPCERPAPTCWRQLSFREGCQGLDFETYTSQRLEHASPEHLHVTSRRSFIGPLPKGWLSAHRKSWYKSWLGLRDYSSRTVTFSADVHAAHQRQLAGLLGPSTAAMYRPSFPQPDDVEEELEDEEEYPDAEPTPIAPVDTAHQTSREAEPQSDPNAVEESSSTTTVGPIPTPEPRPGLSDATSSTSRPSPSTLLPESFYTARESQRDAPGVLKATSPTAERAAESTPRESNPPALDRIRNIDGLPLLNNEQASLTSVQTPPGEARSATSETFLLPSPSANNNRPQTSSRLSSKFLRRQDPSLAEEEMDTKSRGQRLINRVTSGMVRFNIEDNLGDRSRRIHNRLSRTGSEPGSTAKKQREASRSGEILRAERMLVRIERTGQPVPDGFNENDSIKIDKSVISKWREFLVVCRKGCEDNTPFLLQFYKTRVIPQIQTSDMKKKWSYEIPVARHHTKVNLFSTLDKTLVAWRPYKGSTQMFIMRPRSSAHSVEWYTFLREALGWKPPSGLLVHVPDLDISLKLENPFAHLGESRNEDEDACAAVLTTMKDERAIASGIIRTCLATLSGCSEWNKILTMWGGASTKMGLAWRRYDRLEWVQGANEQRMYGTMAMRTTHELELRPKQHYPTSTRARTGRPKLDEPAPTEGFLILLTSQKGRQKLLGKQFFKRLYFYTQDQYLCFCRPAKAVPPAPPRLSKISGRHIPSSTEIRKESPTIYDVDPFPLKDGEIVWLSAGHRQFAKKRDAEAFAENRRVTKNAANAEGYIDLCSVAEIRAMSTESTEEDHIANAGDVEYHGERGRPAGEHSTRHGSKDERSFEIVLENGLTIRFRSYNVETRQEWVKRLTELSTYWKGRTREDIEIMKEVRGRNLKRLEIDETQESMLGQFAQKWEVSRAEASPELYHTCGLSGCRTVKISGDLYRKPRRRGAFTNCSVLLIEGQLLVFQGAVRSWTGEQLSQTHLTRQNAMDLRDCYVYSGIITSSELLYENQSFESNLPGQHARPRMYVDDGWTSSDEDTSTCFVVWHATRKSLFRAELTEKGKIRRRRWRQVSALGVPGRSILFKARSRAERDMWVLAIATEIDRLQQQEDLRIVEST